jgi:hypothetical protein
MTDQKNISDVGIKDLYSILVGTRKLEINLFWQRSNYFLVLSSGMVLGFFNLRGTKYALVFALMGLIASVLWFCVCLGSKFWQTRWEQRLFDFEHEHLRGLQFFSASQDRIRKDVREGFDFENLSRMQRSLYKLALVTKPSVSYSMLRLSILFMFGWTAIIAIYLISGSANPV